MDTDDGDDGDAEDDGLVMRGRLINKQQEQC